MNIEEIMALFDVWSGIIVIIASLTAITITLTKHRDDKYAHSGTLLLNFKNTIFEGDNLILYKAIMHKYRKQTIRKKEKVILKNKSKLLNFLTEFEVMGSLVHRDIMNKHILFDLFRPILLAIKDDDDLQEFIRLRSENAGMPYFMRLKYLCEECNNRGVRGYLFSICKRKF